MLTVKEKFKQICLKATANLESPWDRILCTLSQCLKALTEQVLETSEKKKVSFFAALFQRHSHCCL